MLRLAIIDDEPLARQKLRQMLEEFPDLEIVGEAGNLQEARELLARTNPQAIFLDVRMPRGSGFDLVRSLPASPLVVFVTAYSEYAIEAFEVAAVDYLLKPVSAKRLGEAITRLRQALALPDEEPEPLPYQAGDRICLRTPERTVVAALSDVLALEADGDFTRFTLADKDSLMICQSLGAYERLLPRPPFLRLDRSLLIHLDRVTGVEISPVRGARVFLDGAPRPFEIGRTALRRLRAALPQLKPA